jgi:hypothetical protein
MYLPNNSTNKDCIVDNSRAGRAAGHLSRRIQYSTNSEVPQSTTLQIYRYTLLTTYLLHRNIMLLLTSDKYDPHTVKG